MTLKPLFAGLVGLIAGVAIVGHAAPAKASRMDEGAKAQTGAGLIVLAKHGADDGPGDDRGGRRGGRGGKGRGGHDDGPNHTWNLPVGDGLMLAKNGADDPAGDDRGGRRGGKGKGGKGRGGHDDGPNHT